MGSPTPHSIKIKVIKEWIQGQSRDKIAVNNDIGKGTVTSIIQQAMSSITDINLMRALAIKLKKENLEMNYFASTFRLKKVLDKLELSEERVEALLEEINIHCFRQNLNNKEFVSKIEEVSNLAINFSIPILNIPAFINQKTKQLTDLNKEIAIKQRQIKQIIEEYNITIEDLKEYQSNIPLVDKIRSLEYALSKMEEDKSRIVKDLIDIDNRNKELESKKSVPESEFAEANKNLPKDNPLNKIELQKIADDIFYNPSRYLDIIKIMRDRYRSKFIEQNHNINIISLKLRAYPKIR